MVTLVILDGFGINKHRFGNAIKASGTPYLKKLKRHYPHTTLFASGKAVGLPEGQMGNSEVGHLTLGAGRIILQDLEEINEAVKDGSLASNPNLVAALEHAKKNNSALHLIGLLSNGGVHSHINHLKAILSIAKDFGLKKVFIHVITDGRDTDVTSGVNFVNEIEQFPDRGNAKIATVCGRVFTMDRERRFDRVKKGYDLMVFGEGENFNSATEALQKSYAAGKTDEFVEPCLIDKNGLIKNGDSVIFFNYRSDRAREITTAFIDPKFKEFKTQNFKNLKYTCMKQYDNTFTAPVIFPAKKVEDNLSAIISKNGLKQFHISETTKYAHVTFFFNGTIEEPYKGEDRQLIDSIAVQDFSPYPKMRALEITEGALNAISQNKYDFVLINFSNTDMLGHTGNFEAAKEAAACVDKQVYAVALATLMAGGICIITADHGNAELMYDKFGNKITSHTTNKVPFIIVSKKKFKLKNTKNAGLSNIAPTILKMLNIDIPKNMDKPLI